MGVTDEVRGPRTRLPLVLAVALAGLAVLVVRSPHDVLALLTPTGTPQPVPATAPVDSVGDTTAQQDRTPGDDARSAVGASDGRWGAPARRPGEAGVVVEEVRGGWRVTSGIEEAVALAVVTAHAWVEQRPGRTTGGGQRAMVTVGPVVEAVERPGAFHAVVTLLVGVDGALERIAVPVRLDLPDPAIAGAPWLLPSPSGAPSPLDGTPIGDAVLIEAARDALEGIGIARERVLALEATDGWPFIARLDDDASGHPWLRWHLDRFVVAGLPLDADGYG